MLLIVILLATNIATVTIFAIPGGTYTVQNRESREIYLTRQYFSHKNAMISLSNHEPPRGYNFKFGGTGVFSEYPYRVTVVGDFFRLDFAEEFESAVAKTNELHGTGTKIILYIPGVSSLSENEKFLEHWNLSIRDVAPMDLNGTYYIDPPYQIGYEGRSAWREFYINFLKLLFDAGFDGIELDGGDGNFRLGSFDPETMQRFNHYLASKYTPSELKQKFNITDITTFNFTQYLRDLGYHHNSVVINHISIAHPGPDGPKGDAYAEALWKEFIEFNLKTLLEFYRDIWGNVTSWERETGREFYVSTKITFNNVLVTPYVDTIHWEYTWPNYPNRTASVMFKIYQSLNRTFNLWITPYSSLESTGFSEWYTSGWNKTSDPEVQYLALAEIMICGGRVPVSGGTNITHFEEFTKLFQYNPNLFNQPSYGEIGLVYSVATALHAKELNMSSYFEDSFDCYEGAYYLLSDSHRPLDIVVLGDSYWVNITPTLSDLLKYKAIVLPETLCLTDEQVNLLEQYVQLGGTIIGFGDVATYNEFGEPVSRTFSSYFDGNIHKVGNGWIISIKDISPEQYFVLRTKHYPQAGDILTDFKEKINQYVSPDVWSSNLSERAHVYRFFNQEENSLIFSIINFNYDYAKDMVIRQTNVDFTFRIPSSLDAEHLSIWVYNEENPDGFPISYTYSSGSNGYNVSITIPKLTILTVIEVRPYFEHLDPLIIDTHTVYQGETITLNRDLIVKSTLIISDSELIIHGNIKPIKIEVLPGGALYIFNSRIWKEEGSYYIVARDDSRIIINNSEIVGAGIFGTIDRGGICIETKFAVVENSLIHDNYDFGLVLYRADYSIIGNNKIYNNRIGIAVLNSSFVELFNNTVFNNSLGICIETPDIYDAGVRLRAIMSMVDKGKMPFRGAQKITVTESLIYNNEYSNIAVIGCNFVTIKNSQILNSKGNNIFFWEDSIVKIYNCSISSARVGIYLDECQTNTILGNNIYNHSFAGVFIYRCNDFGVLYWNHLEMAMPDTRIIGNYIRNNTYGLYSDFGWGYFNGDFRIQKNQISENKVGIYINSTGCYIYENNFIDNEKHAVSGPGPSGGWWSEVGPFCVNISKIMYGFMDDPVGNYWDDWDKSTIPYEVCPGYYDYYPLETPVEIPVILDNDGPYITTGNDTIIWYNSTHYKIAFDYYVEDESNLSSSGYKDAMRYFGRINYWGPKLLRELNYPYNVLEFPQLGYPGATAGEVLGPEILTTRFSNKITTELVDSRIIDPSWLDTAVITLYISDMWGNWNKNDSYAPAIGIVRTFIQNTTGSGAYLTIHAIVSDWSPLSSVKAIYNNGSGWNVIDMHYNKASHLYYVRIPISGKYVNIEFKIYAEDICGNSYTSELERYVLDLEPPEILDVFWDPEQPTEHDNIFIYANVTDASGINVVILSYNNGSGWQNVTMAIKEEKENYTVFEISIPAHPVNTEIQIKVYAEDAYGNWAVSKTYSFVIVSSKAPGPLEFPIEYLTVSVVIVSVVIIIVLLRRKREKR